MSFNANLGPLVSDSTYFKNKLSLYKDQFNVAHLNCGSMKPSLSSSKFDEIKNIFCGSEFNCIGISETWLTQNISSKAVEIPGYKFARNDRVGIRGGGVGIYVSKKHKFKIVFKASVLHICESIFVEIYAGSSKILFGVVYLPPPANFNNFDEIHHELFLNYSNIIIVGDFNYNLFDTAKSNIVRSFCYRSNLSICHNSVPSHYSIQRVSTSLIDFMMISKNLLINDSDQVQCPSITYHALIFASFRLNIQCVESVFEYRDLNGLDWDRLLSFLSGFEFSNIFNEANVDNKFQIFSSLIQSLYSFVPIRRINLKTNGDKWMKSRAVALAISHRNLAFTAYQNDPTQLKWKMFCKFRNKAKSVIRREKRKYFTAIFRKLDSAGMWRVLKNTGYSDSREAVFDGDVDYVNEYFATGVGSTHNLDVDFDMFDDSLGSFSFHCVNQLDVFSALNKVKSKSVGVDNVSIQFLKLIYPHISDIILHLINTILTTSTFPSDWKVARVVPIPKTKNVTCPADLRPISILPALSKIVEHIIKDQILLSIDNEIAESQYAFRRGYSTTSLLLSLTDNIRSCVNNRELCVLVSLDLTKAFNSICFSTMINTLKNSFNFSRSACRLIWSYLSGRKQFVDILGKHSGLLPLKSGVPQGSVLGPLLFLLYVNDLPKVISSSMCTPFLFADDIFVLLSTSRHFPDVLEANVNYCLNIIAKWLGDNSLSVNPLKSKAMLFGPVGTQLPVLDVSVCNSRIEFVSQQNCLGVLIDNRLSFEAHFDCIYQKIGYTLRKIYSMGIFLPVEVKKKLAHSLMMPNILYCLEVFSGATATRLKILERAVNSITRFVFNVRRREHISEYVKNFLGCYFFQFVNIRNLVFFYNIIKSGVPNILINKFSFSRSTRNKQILIPQIRCSFFGRSFVVRVARCWNCLPYDLRIFSHSNNVFRLKLLRSFA